MPMLFQYLPIKLYRSFPHPCYCHLPCIRCALGDLGAWLGKLPQDGQMDLTVCRTEAQRDMRGRNRRVLHIDDLMGYSLVIFNDRGILELEDITFIGGEDL